MVMLVAVTCLARRRRMHSRGGSDADSAAAMELEQIQYAPHDQRHHRWPHEPGLPGLPPDRHRRAPSGRQGRGRLPHGGAPAGTVPDSGRRRRRRRETAGTGRASAAVVASEEAPADGGAETASAASSEAAWSPVLCAVCLDEVRRRRRGGEVAEATTLPCSHSYHPGCVMPWLAAHGDCPCCRAAVPSPENHRH